jgi:hypothetical protein
MKLTLFKQCTTDWSFKSSQIQSKLWPTSLPGIAFEGHILLGSHLTPESSVLNHSGNCEDFAKIFKDLFPHLSLVDWSELYAVLPKENFEALLKIYTLQSSHNFFKTLELIKECSEPFQDWIFQKQVSLNEVSIFLSLPPHKFLKIQDEIILQKLSKSAGIQALEIAGELILMGQSQEQLIIKSNHGDEWLEHLKSLRFPRSKKQDQAAQDWLNTLPWPSKSQVKWQRKGDAAGIEIKLFATSPQELKKHITSLQRVQDIFSEQGDTWNLQ